MKPVILEGMECTEALLQQEAPEQLSNELAHAGYAIGLYAIFGALQILAALVTPW